MGEQKIEERKEKVKSWLKDKYNLALLGILIFSFILLLYYFSLTSQQPLWWDEAEYMSIAKYWAFNIPYKIDAARPPLFPFLASLVFRMGLGELTVKFLIVVLPAFLVVLFTYFLIKEMYDEKIALITAFITSVSWIHLFYSQRIMTDSIGLLFGILAFFCFWKGYIKEKGKKYIWLTGVFIALSFLIRLTGILYGAILVVFLFITERFKPLKNKNLWFILILFILTIIPYLLWSQSYFGTPFAFQKGYAGGAGDRPIGWHLIRFVYDYPEFIFFIFFLLGLLTLIPMFLSLDIMLFDKNKEYYNDLFMLLSIIFVLFFFIYFLRDAENRWLIAMSISIFTFSAKGILLVYNQVKKNIGKSIAILVLILILIIGTYYQLKHTDMIIKVKKDSYLPVKEAGLWIKQNSNKGDIILSISEPQTVYYSERETLRFQFMTEQEFEKLVEEKKPKYMIVSIFENGHPEWSYNPPEKYQKLMRPVNAWYTDETKTQAVLIIYEFIY